MLREEGQTRQSAIRRMKEESIYVREQMIWNVCRGILEFSLIIGCLYGLLMLLVELNELGIV